jgi:hypothetical protein
LLAKRRNEYIMHEAKSFGKRPLGRPRRRMQEIINMNYRGEVMAEIGSESCPMAGFLAMLIFCYESVNQVSVIMGITY